MTAIDDKIRQQPTTCEAKHAQHLSCVESQTSYPLKANSLPLLSKEQEQQYGQAVQRGNSRAKELLICHNLRLVSSLAGKYRNRGLSHEDLVSEGYFGLIRAVEKFDPELGFRFSTYATPWIRQAMERALMRMGRAVRLPYGVVNEQRRLARTLRSLGGDQVAVRVASLALQTGQSEQRVRELLGWNFQISSLDALPANSSYVPTSPAPGAELERRQLCNLLASWVAELAPLQREVITLRFGLELERAFSLADIAQRMGLGRNRVRYLLDCALACLSERAQAARLELSMLHDD